MVYVLNKDGRPLMPTNRHGRVRRLLNFCKAKVVKRCPFTIQLLYDSTNHTQDIVLGVDAGSKTIGLSATTTTKELYASNVDLRNDIVNLLSTKKELRHFRRNRKTRYRKMRFNNRVHSKRKGWLAPSIENKIDTHLQAVRMLHAILPISRIVVETASFDIQKIKNSNIKGRQYQNGEQMGFWNVREYVLFRDNHTCQCCGGKSKDPILNVHHLESRKVGGNAPNNLITLCKTCHDGYHNGTLKLPSNIKRGMRFRDATFMGIMRRTFLNRLKEEYQEVEITFGYITKNVRIKHGLPKEHYVDARCISGNATATPLDYYYHQKKVRCHNRQLYRSKTLRSGIRKKNQAPYIVNGFRLFDKVKYQGGEYFIFGRRQTGYFDIRDLSGNRVNKGSISYKKLKLLETRNYYLTERKKAVFSRD